MFPETAVVFHVRAICIGDGLDEPDSRFRSDFRRLIDMHRLSPMPRKAAVRVRIRATARRHDFRTSTATGQDGEGAVSGLTVTVQRN
jgi:xanthine dehydrogenase molybdopterin-binding subunit B